jgi:hypothetical protein
MSHSDASGQPDRTHQQDPPSRSPNAWIWACFEHVLDYTERNHQSIATIVIAAISLVLGKPPASNRAWRTLACHGYAVTVAALSASDPTGAVLLTALLTSMLAAARTVRRRRGRHRRNTR